MMARMKTYAAIFIIAFALGLFAMYAAIRSDRSRTLDPALVSVPTHTITATVTAQDKQVLKKAKAISKKTAQDPDKEVLATGTVKDDSGTRTVAAVLSKADGSTKLEETRPLMESMHRFEVGIGAGLESGDFAKAVQVRYTAGRFGSLYLTGQAEFFFVDRYENQHPWNAMAFVNLRF